MTHAQNTPDQIAPSLKTLGVGGGLSLVAAILAMVLFVMPAEYGVDPLGAGRLMGITGLSADVDAEEAAEQSRAAARDRAPVTQEFKIFLAPQHGLEFKLDVGAGEPIHYSWKIDGQPVEYDLHGEPFDGPEGYFESYATGTGTGGNGWFITPFDGTHGWYLNNQGDQLAVFTATVTGYFEEQQSR